VCGDVAPHIFVDVHKILPWCEDIKFSNPVIIVDATVVGVPNYFAIGIWWHGRDRPPNQGNKEPRTLH
jgi:hypothetical protein